MSYGYKCVKRFGVKEDEHRIVAERMLGRKLRSNEVVHHKNGNKKDNRECNLVVMTRSQHSKLHFKYTISFRKEITAEGRETLRRNGIENTKILWKGVEQLDRDGNVVRTYDHVREVDKFGFLNQHVSACCLGHRKTHRGYFWRFSS